jgi:hypothetical protein
VIAWQNPAALWGLLLVAGPVAVHLLRRHRADRVLFPSLRFVQASQTAAVRLRPPADLLLLFVRAAIVALAVAAAAGPILLTAARTSRWTGNVARAVVVDSSESMRVGDSAAVASEAALAELSSATYGQRFDSPDLLAAVQRVASWLKTTAPSRKEIVVISDFQRGALDPGAARETTTAIDSAVGLRFVTVGRPVESATFEGAPTLSGAGVAAQSLRIDITAKSTAAVLERSPRESSGLRLLASRNEQDAAARLLDAVARAGTPAGASSETMTIRFSGAAQDLGTVEPIRAGWMLDVVAAIGRSPGLQRLIAEAGSAGSSSADLPWVPVLRRENGQPIASAARAHDGLVLDVAASADTFFAAAIVREALTARQGVARYAEREIARIDANVLTSLERLPGPVSGDAWRYADDTADARWCWLGVIALLLVEQWLRTTRTRAAREDVRAAA